MDFELSYNVFKDDHSDLPPPLILNCWKHHREFIHKQIENFSSEGSSGIRAIIPKLLLIGNSQIDIYIGSLQKEQIASEIIDILTAAALLEENKYFEWINSAPNNFRLIELSDRSIWTLRKGLQRQRYVHIHPGRHTLNSIRIRSNTLKTAIMVLLVSKTDNYSPFELSLVNQIRVKILGMAPIKSIERSNGLIELINLLK